MAPMPWMYRASPVMVRTVPSKGACFLRATDGGDDPYAWARSIWEHTSREPIIVTPEAISGSSTIFVPLVVTTWVEEVWYGVQPRLFPPFPVCLRRIWVH